MNPESYQTLRSNYQFTGNEGTESHVTRHHEDAVSKI